MTDPASHATAVGEHDRLRDEVRLFGDVAWMA